jgi:acetyltransferase-like isoleucine patch superfamily enzyme
MGVRDTLLAIPRAAGARLSRGRPRFSTRDVIVGRHCTFGRNVVFNSKRVRIGDGVHVGDDVRVDAEVFEIGDYGTIYQGCFFPGPGEVRIGHNFWLGASSIVDAQGGTTLGNNVGVGAHSQLWTHMVYGDVMAGCRFDSRARLDIADDAWLVGHCLVSPVTIGARALVLLGSVVARNVAADTTVAGVPAVDVTARFGPQFEPTAVDARADYLHARLREFSSSRGVADPADHFVVVTAPEALREVPEDRIGFDVSSRTYTKRGSSLEAAVMRFLLPRAKFVPAGGVG